MADSELASSIFAPGPRDPRWPEILGAEPWLSPSLEPGFRGVAHGDAVVVDEHRTDQLRAIGNSVVALQAGVAFAVLTRRLLT
jgi:DNA (cytosine-5)-methyltransferase 1